MATMYAPGGRRSAAPVVSPRAALTSAAISDDIVTQDLYKAMQMQETPVATAPGAVGSQQAAINLADYIGSGTSVANFGPSSAVSAGGASISPVSVGQAAATAGAAAQGLSALGVLGNNLGMVQSGQTLGQAAVLGSAGASLAAGQPGQAVQTIAPLALSQVGIPGFVTAGVMGLADPTSTSTTVGSNVAAGLISTLAPPVGAVNVLSGLFGGPTIQSMLNDAITNAQAEQANQMAAQQNIDPMDALMAVTNAFGTAPADGGIGIGGDGSGMGVGIDGVTVG